MTERQAIRWIKENLGPIIRKALLQFPGSIYTEDWIGGIICRETGILIIRYKGAALATIASLMRGDYSQRKGEKEKQYHGYGFPQIDSASFPEFVKSGDWKDPYKSIVMMIKVLESKHGYLKDKITSSYSLERAVTAAYNCGEGTIAKVMKAGQDIDSKTFNHDYSKEVWRFRELYKE